MLVLLINDNGATFTDIENTNKDFERVLNWDDAWNTPTIFVRKHRFIAVCSDTGKLRHERVSALSYDNLINPGETLRETFLVGTIIITKFDGTDDFESLNDEDIEILNSRLFTHGKTYLKDFYKTILVLD